MIRVRYWLCACLVIALGVVASGCSHGAAVVKPSASASTNAAGDAAVAKVNGHTVSRSQVDAARAEAALEQQTQTYDQAREAVIGEELVREEAARLGVSVSAADVDRRLAEVTASAGGAASLGSALQAVGLTMAQLRERIGVTLLKEDVGAVKSPGKATSAQARAFYTANLSLFTSGATVDLGDIAVRSQGLAESALKRLQSGQSFDATARQFARAADGGRLGWVLLSSMPAELAKAAAGLKVGQTSPAVAAAGEWHVIKVFGRRAATTLPFGKAQTVIIAELTRRQRLAALDAWLKKVRPAAEVQLLP
jgi:parvulin-like peptidyl-prolyl isomerase